jgi:hypothetical protein
MLHSQATTLSWILFLLEKGGSIVKLKEQLFVFDSDGLCLFKTTNIVLMGVLKDGRCERLQGEMCTEYRFLKKYVIDEPDGEY